MYLGKPISEEEIGAGKRQEFELVGSKLDIQYVQTLSEVCIPSMILLLDGLWPE